MNTKQNPNFISVEEYGEKINIARITRTDHAAKERNARIKAALECVGDATIDSVFLVDKGHPDGPELHCVLTNAMIVILNRGKYENGRPCLITVLFGRPNQVKRLYEAVGKRCPKEIVDCAVEFVEKGMNNW